MGNPFVLLVDEPGAVSTTVTSLSPTLTVQSNTWKGGAEHFTIEDGVPVKYEQTGTPSRSEYGGTTVIPDGVTKIGDAATSGSMQNIVHLVLPEGLTHIGKSAFVSGHKLESVVMPNTVVDIGDSAFVAGFKLKDITLSGNLTTIGADAFRVCSSLQSIDIPEH